MIAYLKNFILIFSQRICFLIQNNFYLKIIVNRFYNTNDTKIVSHALWQYEISAGRNPNNPY